MPGSKKKAVLECGCCGSGCCHPRCEPLRVVTVGDDLVEVEGDCVNPLPLTLEVDLTSTSTPPGYTCFAGSGTLTFRTPLSTPSGEFCWEGTISGTCTDCNANTFNWSVGITLCCDVNDGSHVVTLSPGSGMLCPAVPLSGISSVSVCDPFLLSGCFPDFGACFICFEDSPVFEVCYEIYEVP